MNIRKTLLGAKRLVATSHFYLMMAMLFLVSPAAFALQNTDLTQDQSNGKNLTTMATNVDNTRQIWTTVVIGLFAFGGMIVVGVSLFALHRAAKEDREKPLGAIVGVVVGGLCTSIGFIMWIVHNTLTT